MSTGIGQLTPFLLEKAQTELNEDPNTRKQEIAALRERLLRVPGLQPRVDDAYLLRFLRARKFDQERTFELVLNHYQMKKDNEDIFAEMTPKNAHHMLEAGVTMSILGRSKNGETVLINRIGRWNADKYPLVDLFKAISIVLNNILESEETQINGIRIINDLTDVGWAHARSINPVMARKISALMQDSFPMRLKGIHYVHEPSFFDYIFSVIRPFLKEKLQKRLNFHGEKVEELHEFIDPDYLPEEYKGTQLMPDPQEFYKMLLDRQADYEENAKFGYVSMTIQSNKSEDAMENLPGTFKKLNVD